MLSNCARIATYGSLTHVDIHNKAVTTGFNVKVLSLRESGHIVYTNSFVKKKKKAKKDYGKPFYLKTVISGSPNVKYFFISTSSSLAKVYMHFSMMVFVSALSRHKSFARIGTIAFMY